MEFYEPFFNSMKYILQSYSKVCFKACRQQPMKLMVKLSETNASVVEFDGNGKPPLLLSSSCTNGVFFSLASIEHMILYLSVLVFLINFSNIFPCKLLQIDLLYQGPPVIQSELCLSISYYNCLFVLIIHDIPTWCNTVFNTNEVIISLYLVFILSIDK